MCAATGERREHVCGKIKIVIGRNPLANVKRDETGNDSRMQETSMCSADGADWRRVDFAFR
jgi:hypothetical protein